MRNKYVFVAVMLCAILLGSVGLTGLYTGMSQSETEDEEFVVVTSFYPMYIAALNVVEDAPGVTLKNLSEPQTGCLHDFQLTPADMKLLSTADVFIINGGGIESFMEEIAKSYPDLIIIDATAGLDLLEAHGSGHNHEEESEHKHEDESEHVHEDESEYVHEDENEHVHEDESEHVHEDESEHEHEEEHENEAEHENEDAHDHGDVNAHAWMSVSLYRKQVETIAEGLAKANPENASLYEANREEYDVKLVELEEKQLEVAELVENQSVIMFHCAFDYVAEDYGLDVAYCMDLDEERQVSAGEVAEVLSVIETEGVQYIFAEELYGKGMCDMVQNSVDVTVVYLDPLNRGAYDKDSYIEGMSNNIELIKEALIP